MNFGVYDGSQTFFVETVAKNVMNFSGLPDERGNEPVDVPINSSLGIDTHLAPRVDVSALVANLKKKFKLVEPSTDAGDYICNQMFYKACQMTNELEEKDGISCAALFCHFPSFETIPQAD